MARAVVREGADLSYLSTTVMVWILNVLVGQRNLKEVGPSRGNWVTGGVSLQGTVRLQPLTHSLLPRCVGEWLCPTAHSDGLSRHSPKATGHDCIEKPLRQNTSFFPL